MASTVYLALQANDETRPIIEAVQEDNPHAEVEVFPAMVKINAPGKLVVRRETVEEKLGREWDVRELNVNMISISGNVDETEDEFILEWKN